MADIVQNLPVGARASGWIAAIGASAATIFYLTYTNHLQLALVLSAGVFLVCIFKMKFFVYAFVILGIGTLPVQSLGAVRLGPLLLYSYEVPLAVLVAYSAKIALENRSSIKAFFPLILLATVGVFMGIASGNDLTKGVLYEARPALLLISASFVTFVLARTRLKRALINALRVTLIVSALATVTYLAGYSQINATIGTTSLNSATTGGADSIVRIQSPTTHAALAVLTFCLVVAIRGRLTTSQVVTFVLPALLITTVGFSRNGAIALAVALVIAVALARSWSDALRSIIKASTLALTIVILATSGRIISQFPGGAALQMQFSAYFDRVISGLFSAADGDDGSTRLRLAEIDQGLRALRENIFLGHGFGFHYRAPTGEAGSFSAGPGTMYIHNYYVWLLIKVGIVGLLIFTVPILVFVYKAVRKGDVGTTASAATMTAFLAVITVAPLPLGELDGGAITFGTVLGVLVLASYPGLGDRDLYGKTSSCGPEPWLAPRPNRDCAAARPNKAVQNV
jgi:hypothetical protein